MTGEVSTSQHERTKGALHYFNQSAVSAIMDDIPGASHNADEDEDDSGGQ